MSDAVRPAARPTVLIDNERTRVTEWRFAPGAATGWHRHEMDYVVVPIGDGRLRIVTGPGEESVAELRFVLRGEPVFRLFEAALDAAKVQEQMERLRRRPRV